MVWPAKGIDSRREEPIASQLVHILGTQPLHPWAGSCGATASPENIDTANGREHLRKRRRAEDLTEKSRFLISAALRSLLEDDWAYLHNTGSRVLDASVSS